MPSPHTERAANRIETPSVERVQPCLVGFDHNFIRLNTNQTVQSFFVAK